MRASRRLAWALMSCLGLCGPNAWSQSPTTTVSERPWPQPLQLQGPQVAMFGFATTQPGPVVVNVQTQGAPVSVLLEGPMPQPLQQQGSGAVRVAYTVTAQDVQRGVLWRVTIQLLPPAAAQGAAATGSVNIQHPPADPSVVQRAIATVAPVAKPSDQELAQRGAQFHAARQAAHAQRLAAAEGELTQHRADVARIVQPQLDALRRQIVAPGAAPAPSGITTRGLPPRSLPLRGPPAPSQISSLSAAEGVPGDGIMINGTGFGTSPGEVHFVIGPALGQDLPSTGVQWTGTSIFAPVPDPSVPDPSVGAAPYQGVLYVLVGGVKSNLMPFKFDPIIDHRWITVPADYLLSTAGSDNFFNQYYAAIQHTNFQDLSGKSGDDKLFRHTYLQNGWTVETLPSAFLIYPTSAGVGPAIAAIGSNSLATDVFWWVGSALSYNYEIYTIEIPIRGPRGLPDGVVCASKPAVNQPCPNGQ